jgi:HSP20 family protein
MAFWMWNDPFEELTHLQRSIDRVFQEAYGDLGQTRASQPRQVEGREKDADKGKELAKDQPERSTVLTTWRPRFNISETDKEYRLTADVPGVPKEDIKIEVKDGVLTISGEKKEEKREENEKFHTYERIFGSFSRSVRLPEGVKPENITAKFTNGVLEITFPKPEAPPSHTIAIQ